MPVNWFDPTGYMIGDVAVFMGGRSKSKVFQFAYVAIKFFQRVLRRVPKGRDAVHVMLRVEPAKMPSAWQSTEWPRTIRRELRIPWGERVAFLRYKRREEITPAGWGALYDISLALNGQPYDPVDLLNFVGAFFRLGKLKDLGDDKLVCSTAVARIWEGVAKASSLPPIFPGGWESVTPADWYNCPAFEVLEVIEGRVGLKKKPK